ncbi:MAG TPA: hypothetical protein ENG51_07990 [Deltaproteobacteria bacterium]|nr:hypothetical protein [Deltaproteobacteria bacterium]
MAEIIDIHGKNKPPDNVINSSTFQFRWADWESGNPIQCTVMEAEKYEKHRIETIRDGHKHISFVPSHFALTGGYFYTIRGIFDYRNDDNRAIDVYHLAGLMECVVNSTAPILRTDLLRSVYKKILSLKNILNVKWQGNVNHFLLPLHPDFYNPSLFLTKLNTCETLNDLYKTIKIETRKQYDIIKTTYVFYLPRNTLFM